MRSYSLHFCISSVQNLCFGVYGVYMQAGIWHCSGAVWSSWSPRQRWWEQTSATQEFTAAASGASSHQPRSAAALPAATWPWEHVAPLAWHGMAQSGQASGARPPFCSRAWASHSHTGLRALEELLWALLDPRQAHAGPEQAPVIHVCVLSSVLCALCSACLALWRCGPCYSKETNAFLNAFPIKVLHGDYLKTYLSKTCLSPFLGKCYSWFFRLPVMWRIFCCLPFFCSSPHSCIT